MKYTYAYKTSDGKRHEASMEAESREAVFEALRARGIKAIKVVAADGSKANGEPPARTRRVSRLTALFITLAAVAVAVWVSSLRSGKMPRPPTSATEIAPPVTFQSASPLPRQTIPGNRQRIEEAAKSLPSAPERLLAAFAEPGRPVAAQDGERPTDAEFAASLREPLRIAPDEFTESVDLKRIVTGIKADMRGFLADGGTIDDYLAELVKRQKLEISYREKAETRLSELLKEGDKKSAYDFWLKANAQLQSMGIYTLPLPDALRDYQMSQGLDE